ARLDGGRDRLLLLGAEPREGAREHELAHARRIGRRVRDRDDAPVRMPEQVDLLELEVVAQLVEIRYVVGDAVAGGIARPRRVARPARVEHDEGPVGAEAREVAEVGRAEAGPARMADEDLVLALAPVGERPAVPGCQRALQPRLPSTTRSRPVRSALI